MLKAGCIIPACSLSWLEGSLSVDKATAICICVPTSALYLFQAAIRDVCRRSIDKDDVACRCRRHLHRGGCKS